MAKAQVQLLLAASMALFLCISGCAKQKTYGAVKFTSNPAGAEVVNLRDDATLGTSPVIVTWEGEEGEPEYVTIQMRKKGYKEDITSLWVNKRYESREAAIAAPQDIHVEMEKRGQE